MNFLAQTWWEIGGPSGIMFLVGSGFLALFRVIWNWSRPRMEKLVDAHLSLIETLKSASHETSDAILTTSLRQSELHRAMTEMQRDMTITMKQLGDTMTAMMQVQTQVLTLIKEHHETAVAYIERHGGKTE